MHPCASACAHAPTSLHTQAKAEALPAEPEASTQQPVSTCLVRLPDGSRLTRRFLSASPLQVLFDFIDANGAGGLAPGSYQLVGGYPRRVVGGALDGSLLQADLGPGQHVLLLEPVKRQVSSR